jgi:hypothetical protein
VVLTVAIAVGGWIVFSISFGALWSLLKAKRRERDELLEEWYERLAASSRAASNGGTGAPRPPGRRPGPGARL